MAPDQVISADRPRLRTRIHATAKAGNRADEYEDAWACSAPDCAPPRYAVADGATETSFSGLWAQYLVEAYCRGRLRPRLWDRDLEPLQARWRAHVWAQPMPWYAEEKARAGAFAAFAGVTLTVNSSGDWRWRVVAAGDSCLLHISDGAVRSFPVASPQDFGRAPRLISTEPTANVDVRPRSRSGALRFGDRLILATDALACTLLSSAADALPQVLERLDAEFDTTIDQLRTCGALRNDDVTMLAISLE